MYDNQIEFTLPRIADLVTWIEWCDSKLVTIRSIRSFAGFATRKGLPLKVLVNFSTFYDQSRLSNALHEPTRGVPSERSTWHIWRTRPVLVERVPYFPFIFTSRQKDSDLAWLTGRKTQSVALDHWQFGRADKGSKSKPAEFTKLESWETERNS